MKKNESITILYVEDQDEVRLFLFRILSRHYSNIILAENGKVGLELYEQHKPDIVITDIKMPLMDGLTMASTIKESNPSAKIILTTAHSDMDFFIHSIDIGISEYILKPIDRKKLFKAIDNCVKQVIAEKEIQKERDKLRETNTKLTQQERILRENLQKTIALKEMISRSEENFRQLAENVEDAFWLQGKKVLYVNNAFEKIFEIPVEELLSDAQVFLTRVHPEDKDSFISLFTQHIQSQSPFFQQQFRIQTLSGNIKFVWLRSTFINHDKPGDQRHVIVVSDLSRQKENEELHQNLLLAEKSAKIRQQFLANINHEMRTPLNGIIGMSEILAGTPLSDNQLDYIQTINTSGQELLTIINDLLSINEIEEGKLVLNAARIETADFISKLEEQYQQTFAHKLLDFQISREDNFPARFIADKQKINQVVKNLLSNALKFTPEGSVRVEFRHRSTADSTYYISITVADTGIGIKKENAEKIFELFTQQENNDSRKFSGLGIGLSICSRIADFLNGKIEFESIPGQGSSFTFSFPAKSPEAGKSLAEKPDLKDHHFNANILYAEDKEVNQKVLSIILKNVGCMVDIARNGQEALDMVEKSNYDLILMDIQMPVMDGITATKELKKRHKDLPPVIGISANAMRADAQGYIAQGLDDYIAKPVSPGMIYALLQEWLPEEKKYHGQKTTGEQIMIPDNNEVKKICNLNESMLKNLKEQTQDNQEVLKDLFITFLKEADVLIDTIHQAAQTQNKTLMKESVHALKGLSATVGADKIYHISLQWSRNHTKGDFDFSEASVKTLHTNYEKLKKIIYARFDCKNYF